MQADGNYTYMPDTNYIGSDEFIYQICDNGVPVLCERAKVTIWIHGPDCIDLQVQVFLEGPYDLDSNAMTTILNTGRNVLPGQIPFSPYTQPIPPGHPYSIAPWNYQGTEGMDFDSTSYNKNVVDWLLISLRSSPAPSSQVFKTAALLEKDGTVTFVGDCIRPSAANEAYYVVIEHRNHLAAMSVDPVMLQDFVLAYDFSAQNSYNGGAGFGQKEIIPGTWTLYAGDGDQLSDLAGYDISGEDRVRLTVENGNFNTYMPSDFNLDGDVNGRDKILWSNNNGVFSVVPR